MTPKQERTLREIRKLLRPRVKNNSFLMGLFGFKYSRRRRGVDPNLRRPTMEDREQARRMRRRGMTNHRVEAIFNRRGIRMTRNMQSRDDGARA